MHSNINFLFNKIPRNHKSSVTCYFNTASYQWVHYIFHCAVWNKVAKWYISCSEVQYGTCIMLWLQCSTCIMFCGTMLYMNRALRYNGVHVSYSEVQCATCIMLWGTMHYMYHVLRYNAVHVSCSKVQCGTCIMLWGTMQYMYHVLRYNAVHVSSSEVHCSTCIMFWSTMLYMYRALRYNVVHVSCS